MPYLYWKSDEPPVEGAYLAVWVKDEKIMVSEFWFNPSMNPKWWINRPYLGENKGRRHPADDAIKQNIMFWMEMPEAPIQFVEEKEKSN